MLVSTDNDSITDHALVRVFTLWYACLRFGTRVHALVRVFTLWYACLRFGTRVYAMVRVFTLLFRHQN